MYSIPECIVIIPVHNEVESISAVVAGIGDLCPYIIVNDHSDDGTDTLCRESNYPFISANGARGKQNAVRTGIQYALDKGYQYAVTLDGDARTVAADQILRAAGAAGNGQHVYLCYAFGNESFATVDPAGGWLEVIVKGKEYGGPLNQFSTIGYKFETNGATILYPERMVRLECLSSYGATDDAN